MTKPGSRSWTQPLSALALLLLGACATTPVAPPESGIARVEEGPAFLWAVEDPDGDRKTLYLMGSVHMLRDGTALPESVEAIIESTKVLAVEVDTSQVDERTLQHAIQTRGMRTEGESTEALLPEALRPKLREALGRAGLPREAGLAMRPWVLTLVLSMDQAARAGFGEQHGVETRLLSRLRGSHRVVEVEGLEAQVASLSDTPDEAYQFAIEHDLTRGPEAATAELESLVRAWETGDVAAMKAVILADMADPRAAVLIDHIYRKRNAQMAEQVVSLLAEGEPALVVLGAAHMVGEDGVPNLLRQRGFKVRQLGRSRASLEATRTP